MSTLVVRGQTTLSVQKDPYTITQSIREYIFPANSEGKILSAITLTSFVKVTCGDSEFSEFTIEPINKPSGFLSITVNNSTKSITYEIAAGTNLLADHGTVDIPITISGIVYHLSFAWSKAKAGIQGTAGADANILDWVKEWDTGKTLIGSHTVITPKLFAGTKNNDGTISGIAIGSFSLITKSSSGAIRNETVNGIYGYKDGYETFYVDNDGNAQLGHNNEYVRYNAATGKIEFGSAVSLHWVGATYINKDGVFTGILSADSVRAIALKASQITSGTISASRIDTASLKALLVTAGNIEALTLNVTKGKIGGWTIEEESLYRGTKNNSIGAYTSAAGSITLGTNGIRGCKWRLDSSGAGALAGGNIIWDVAGNITFAPAVSVQWTRPLNSITTALGGDNYPKLTKITAEGIYTGSITASQITTGTISADRIAAGSINSSKLDAASIKASIVNTDYINGLTCTFSKGKIGGWTIGASALSSTHISIDSGNKRIAVFGANSTAVNGQRVQLYYNSDTDFGLYVTNPSGVCVARLGSHNQIAGWSLDANSIRKGNVSLGSNGSITNSTKWKFNNDGSGQIASGNIAWDTAGNVSFGESVSLLWKNDIEVAKTSNFGYRYYKRIVINGDDETYYPVIFKGGDQNIKRDILVRRTYLEQAPDAWNTASHKGGLILLIKANFGSWGGIGYSWDIYELSETYCRMFGGASHCGNCCMFAVFLRGGGTTGAVYHIYSDQPIDSGAYSPNPIPAAPQIAYDNDLIMQVGSSVANAPAPRTLTATVKEEIRRHKFIALAQSADSTLVAHPLTHIGSTGIYTGTLTAAQVNAVNIDAGSIRAGTISADRIAAGSINATKLDAASIKSSIINTDYINGLSCTFIRGQIGGFTIGSDNMTVGTVGSAGTTPLQIRSQSLGSGYWYAGGYKPFGICLTWHQNANAGHIVFGQVAASGNSAKTGFVGIQMMSWDHQEYFCLSANFTKSGSKDVYNRIAGWAFDHNHIWKNNISLSSDGSITNSAKWKLNNDGSGILASGNISWDASGNVSFSDHVSLAWRNGINDLKIALGGENYPKLTHISESGIYTGTINAQQILVNSTLVVGGSSYNGSISVQDASNNVKATLDRDGITAVGGKIGGWILGASALTASAPSSGHRIVMGASGYIYHDNPTTALNYWALKADGSATFGCGKISFANDGSGYLANKNITWDTSGNVTMTGTINANSGTIGGFLIGQGRIGSTATSTGSGGGLAIYDDLFRVGDTISYVLFGSNTIPASAGGACATGRIVNNKVNNFYNNNYGLYIDVKNATRNYGVWSNASLVAPACIGNKIKNIYFTGSGYTMDFSQYNIFFVYANKTYSVTLPPASSVASMFGYSSLPSDFACVFTLVYNHNWGNSLIFNNIYNANGDLTNYTMAKGDSIVVLCANYPSFHYQILNHAY